VWQAFYCVADGNHAALRRTAVLVLLPRVRRPGAHFVFARFLLPPLLWTAASVDTTNHKGQGNRTGRWDSTRPGSKRELAGAVPDQAEGNAAASVAEAIFQVRALREEELSGPGDRD